MASASMESLLNTAIYIGPVVFLLGLLVAITCLALQLSAHGGAQILRRALAAAGLGVAGFAVGTGLGIAFFCSSESAGNLCGLGGVLGTGPFAAGLCMGCYAILALRARRSAP
jgi:hypothetical protein